MTSTTSSSHKHVDLRAGAAERVKRHLRVRRIAGYAARRSGAASSRTR